MLKRFPYSPRGKEHPDTATRLSEGVAMTNKEAVAVDHQGPIPPEHVTFHVHGLDALVVEMAFLNDKMKAFLDDLYKSRMFKDDWYPISANVAYEVDYRDHKLLFLYSLAAVTLSILDGGTIIVPPNSWVSISLHRGAKVYAQGVPDNAPITVLVRACDFLQDTSTGLLSELVDIEAQTGTSDYPFGATPIVATSGNQANGVATATLAASLTQKTWITGFEVTGSGATTGLDVTVMVTNVLGVTLSYTYTFTAGALVANTPLIIEFVKPLPTAAVNTAIAVSCPAGGLGNTNNTVVAHGYQL